MKQIFFNELTLNATPEENQLWIEGFLKVLKQLANRTGKKVNRVFAEGKVLERLYECVGVVEDNNLRNEISAYLTGVYDPKDEGVDGRIRDQYFGVEYGIQIGTAIKSCPSLGWAYLNDSITIGFASGPKWISTALHQMIETPLEGDVRIVDDVVCVVNPLQLDDEYVRTWIGVNFGAETVDVQMPQPCNIDPSQKKIHYRDDHGREVIDAFARQLVRNEFVVEVINSTEWDSRCNHFIDDVRQDGVVYVRMHWESRGYGLAVKTTARGIPQTMLVGKELERKFDRK